MVSLIYQQCCQGMKYHYSEKGSHEMGYVKIESIQIAQVLKPSTRDMYTKASNLETAE